ncbi:chromate transporter [Poseidonocella pacifica]|uniref:Chromate transporter n=1 Tax=Poseidonocella pacifica TaxID=871651 RepID=A0A1I0XXX6_9RHOB|nr:chromate efflux transporter [Poseidonocella pacifica]SFB05882.1 chromate transporter [Poseidonocella pacifica]
MTAPIPLSVTTRTWARIALLSFGGPAGQIAVMHRIVVEEKRWIGEARFLNALNFCMLLPGPEAQQLAIYLGWLMNRTAGGVVAGVLFVLPGFVSILALSLLYAAFGHVPAIEGLFFGLTAAVLAIVVQAVLRIGSRALHSKAAILLAALSFLALYAFAVPFPAIVVVAGLTGLIAGRRGNRGFGMGAKAASASDLSDQRSLLGEGVPAHAKQKGATLRPALICLVLWLVPVGGLLLALGPDATFSRLGVFFSQLAVVTFGGAYAVLAYVAQAAVELHGWLTPEEMLDGLGMAETTPGPLIQVVQFVGFLAAFRFPDGLNPWLAAVLASCLVTWVTFLPSFLWIFLGAPHIERLRANPFVASGLAAITAAIVGVVLNLALWFAVHALFKEQITVDAGLLHIDLPIPSSVDPVAALLAAGAAVAIFRFNAGVLSVLAVCAGGGMAYFGLK